MSLINQMLKDLEQRNASAEGLNPLSGDVRTVQTERKGSDSIRVVLILAVLLLCAAAAWWKISSPAMQPSAHPVAVAEAKKPQKAPQQPPLVQAPAPPVVAQADTQAAGEPSGSRLTGLDKELRTSPASEPPQALPEKSKPMVGTPAELGALPEKPLKPAEVIEKSRVKPAIKPLSASMGIPIKSVNPQQKSDNLYRQALAMLQQGRVAEARTALTQSLEENPSDHNARQLLVGLLVENKHNDEALSLLQEGVRIAPDQTGFVMALARLQVEAGDRKTALQTMEQGAKYAADDADYQGFYAALLQRDERHDEAVSHYLSALRSDPANTSWLIGVGISLQARNQYVDARDAFERARQTGQLSPELADFVEQRLKQLKGK